MSEVVEIVINAVTGQSVDAIGTLSGAFNAFTGIINTGKQMLDGALKLVKEFGEEEASIAKLNAVLKATGRESGAVKDSMLSLANSMQKTTMFADEQVINAQALMATFKNINDNVFPETITLSADLASLWGMDLSTAVRLVGKALDSPAEGMGMLSRYGIKLSDDTEVLIKSLVSLGRTEDAQKIILDELRSKVGGVAEAMGETAPGKLKKFENAMSNIKEASGKAIWEGLEPLTDAATKSADAIGDALSNVLGDFSSALGKGFKEKFSMFFDSQWFEKEVKKMGIVIKGFNDDYILSSHQTKAEQEKMGRIMLESSASAGVYGKKVIETERAIADEKKKAAEREAKIAVDKAKRFEEEKKHKEELLRLEKAHQEAALEAIGERTDRQITIEKKKWKAIDEAMGHGLTKEQELQKEVALETEKLMKDLEKLSKNVISGTVDAFNKGFEAFGAALVKGEDANEAFWKAFGNAGKEMIAKVLEAFGAEWAQLAVAAALALDFIGAIGYGLASAAAYTGAGIVRAIPMARGGEMTVSRPTHFLAGEAGAEKVRVTPLEKEGEPASGIPKRMVLSIGGQEITAYIQDQIDRGALRMKRA